MCQEELATAIDKAVFPGTQGGPLMHIIAAKAAAFGEALRPEFKDYQRRIVENAKALAAALMERNLVIISGGTDNHLMLVDVRPAKLTGKKACTLLETVKITTNKNTIPNDPEKPFVGSAIRIGTPAVTTRGMGTAEMKIIGNLIADVLYSPEDEAVKARTLESVAKLCAAFPLYKKAGSKLVGVR